ncbi:MAG: tetratricopeptide repeat protein, partial [Pricia sp.]
ETSFTQYFMPYYNVGVVKNATQEALLNLEMEDGKALLKIHVTSVYPNCTILLANESKVLFEEMIDLSPKDGFEKKIFVDGTAYGELTASLKDAKEKILVAWTPEDNSEQEIPEAAKAAKKPKDIDSVEQLYLRGLHLEQYRHATYNPTDYYLEALSRAPGDVRNNNAMGLWYLKKGRFEKALPYFDAAIETLTQHNPNPYNGEPYFNRGLALKFMGKKEEAYGAFYKSCWNAAWQDAGYFNLAQIDCERGNLEKALELVSKALIKNWHNHKARHLKAILLRKLGRDADAMALIVDSLTIDRFNFGMLYEKYVHRKDESDLNEFKELLRDYPHNYIEFSLDYAMAGQYEEAISLLQLHTEGKSSVYPMALYFLGWYHEQNNDSDAATEVYEKAAQMPMDYCFPNRLEEVLVLQSVMESQKEDGLAPYYLGNFWYASRQYDYARECWEIAEALEPENAICLRNLSLLYYNKVGEPEKARQYLEKAFSLESNNARLLMELDQLYKKINVPIDERLSLLGSNLDLTQQRDDLYLERVSLYNFKGQYEKALDLIGQRQFHPWEGGEGKVPFQYVTAHVEAAKQQLAAGHPEKAIEHLEAARSYPHNLGEGKLYGTQENDIDYWSGCAYDALSDMEKARNYWQEAATGLSELGAALFYNDQQPDKIFYQGLALIKLERTGQAQELFQKFISYGKEHLNDDIKLDYFAISLPDLLIWEEDLNVRNTIHCQYLIGLGQLGMNLIDDAITTLSEVIGNDAYHLPADIHLNMAEKREPNFQKT